jgi:anti-sigma factor RsiW
MTNPICWLTRRRLGAYQDGELPPGARARVEGHVAGCAGCAGELRALEQLHAALAVSPPEVPAAVWDAFWPQVRSRLATEPVTRPAAGWGWIQEGAWGRRRVAVGTALAVAALGGLAILGPWQRVAERPVTGVAPVASAPGVSQPAGVTPVAAPAAEALPRQVLVQSVETGDPGSSVMVFSPADSDFDVLWVFGLQRTET